MHLSDRRIIAFARGDNPRWLRRRLVNHLQACPSCRARLARMGEVRDAVREATNVPAPDRFQEVLARLDEGEVVILPIAQPNPTRPLISRRVAAIAAALAISAAGAVAALRVLGPMGPTAGIEAPIMAPAVPTPVAGLALPLSADSFVVRIAAPWTPTAVRVALTSGEAVEVMGVGAASRSQFQATPEGIDVSETPGGELRVSVPVSAGRVLVRHGAILLVEVAEGRFLIHSPARLQGDSLVFLDVGPAAGSDTIAPGGPS